MHDTDRQLPVPCPKGEKIENIWIFSGGKNPFPSAVFAGRTLAEDWIRKHGLSGTLTRYPVNVSVYAWTIAEGYFRPKGKHQSSSGFIQNFSSAYMMHYHYDGGERHGESGDEEGHDEQPA